MQPRNHESTKRSTVLFRVFVFSWQGRVRRSMTRPGIRFLAIAAVLGAIAAIAGTPVAGDRDVYQKIGRQVFVLDCHDIHCSRLLPAPIIEHLPGPSLMKWRAYAVLTNAAAAIALGRLRLARRVVSRGARD